MAIGTTLSFSKNQKQQLAIKSKSTVSPDSNVRGDVPYLFRTDEPPPRARDDVYENFRSDPKHHPSAIPLHKVARATAAAPAYFRPVRILPAHRGRPLPAMRFKMEDLGVIIPARKLIMMSSKPMENSAKISGSS